MITTEMLKDAGCFCMNGYAYDCKGRIVAQYFGDDLSWIPAVPQHYSMKALNEFGVGLFVRDNPKPHFRVKAISKGTK